MKCVRTKGTCIQPARGNYELGLDNFKLGSACTGICGHVLWDAVLVSLRKMLCIDNHGFLLFLMRLLSSAAGCRFAS
jgi:hypothetical protein